MRNKRLVPAHGWGKTRTEAKADTAFKNMVKTMKKNDPEGKESLEMANKYAERKIPMTDEQLYYKLEPDGCWHGKIDEVTRLDFEKPYYECTLCKRTKTNLRELIKTRPDFSTWAGFGWLWERTYEREDDKFSWSKFVGWMQHNYMSFGDYIHPTRFRDALKEFFGGEG